MSPVRRLPPAGIFGLARQRWAGSAAVAASAYGVAPKHTWNARVAAPPLSPGRAATTRSTDPCACSMATASAAGSPAYGRNSSTQPHGAAYCLSLASSGIAQLTSALPMKP